MRGAGNRKSLANTFETECAKSEWLPMELLPKMAEGGLLESCGFRNEKRSFGFLVRSEGDVYCGPPWPNLNLP